MPHSSSETTSKVLRNGLVLLSFVGATALAYFTLSPTAVFVGKPLLVYTASVAIGIATILPSFLGLIIAEKGTIQAENLHGSLKEHTEELHASLRKSLADAEGSRLRVEELYGTLEGRLRPLLLNGLEDMLKRIADVISEKLSEELGGERLSAFIFMKHHDDFWVVAAANVEKTALVRRMALGDDEGIVGFTSQKEARILANGPKNLDMFAHRDNRNLGKQNPLRAPNLDKCDPDVAWIFAEPIFVTEGEPWDRTVVGVLTVDSKNDEADRAFRQPTFVDLVDTIAAAASPYLAVLKGIPNREQKTTFTIISETTAHHNQLLETTRAPDPAK